MKKQKYPQPIKTTPRACLIKRAFSSKREAEEYAEVMYSNITRAYVCNRCNKWHITSNIQGKVG